VTFQRDSAVPAQTDGWDAEAETLVVFRSKLTGTRTAWLRASTAMATPFDASDRLTRSEINSVRADSWAAGARLRSQLRQRQLDPPKEPRPQDVPSTGEQ